MLGRALGWVALWFVARWAAQSLLLPRASLPGMGKRDRHAVRTAYVTLRDLPGSRVMFWVVDECPYCGGRHFHPAGNLRTADPGERLGEQPAMCDPSLTYELTLPPRPKKKNGKQERRKERREGKRDGLDEDL